MKRASLFLFFLLATVSYVFSETYEIDLPILPLDVVDVSEEKKVEAEKLFREALLAAEKGDGSGAMELAIRALESNPNQEKIRAILGFRLHEGQWRTAWEIDRLKKGFVDHPEFGWIPREHVDRYEKGERFAPQKGWIAAADDAKLRTKIQDGWELSTEHYDLLTNHSLEEGVRIVRRLEHLYRAWKLLFFNFILSDETLAKMFQGRSSGTLLPRHKVCVYRDKADYIENLKGIEPNIAISNGYYSIRTKKSYFFPVSPEMDADEADHVRKTLFHEGTHQLFQETRLTVRTPGQQFNFWLVEGIAMLMETFHIANDRYRIGDGDDGRLYAAKIQKTEQRFYIPFGVLARMGSNDFIASPDIRKIYSQSAGMTHFLVFGENGRYRHAVIKLLRQIYAGTDRADSLSQSTGSSFQQLDEEYDAFLKKLF